MKVRREGDEMCEKRVWRALKGAQSYLPVRRAPGRSTRCVFTYIGSRSRRFMNRPGWESARQKAAVRSECQFEADFSFV